jgi:hypothetical protein
MSYLLIAAAVVGVGVVVWKFVLPESVKQMFRIRGNSAVKAGTKGSERAQDAVDQAVAKLPNQRKLVARLMTAAQRSQKNAIDKGKEAEALLEKVALAKKSNGSAKLIQELTIQWKTAKDSIATLDEAAKTAHDEAEEAQQMLDSYLTTIQTSQEAVNRISATEDMTAILRESAAFRQQATDLKKGLGSLGVEARAAEDELANARNEAELSKGSKTDREMEDLERKDAADKAQAELDKALADKAAGK